MILVNPRDVLISGPAAAPTKGPLVWKLEPGVILQGLKFGHLTARVGGRKAYRLFRNRILLKTEKQTSRGFLLSGRFWTYQGPAGPLKDDRPVSLLRNGKIWQLNSLYQSRFELGRDGKYQVSGRYFMPNLRHIPFFPDRVLKVGATWRSPGEEIFQDGATRIPLQFPVEYQFLGIQNAKIPILTSPWTSRQKIARVHYSYPFSFSGTPGSVEGGRGRQAVKLEGLSRGKVFFSVEAGVPLFERNEYEVRVKYTGRPLVSYKMVIDSYYRKLDREPARHRRDLLTQIQKDMKKEPDPVDESPAGKAGQVQVGETPEGVTFALRDILFDFAKAELKPSGREALDKISRLLKKYPGHQIRVEGHTDSTGNSDYNRKLSRERARAVATYLNRRGIAGHRLAFTGRGESEPVADNGTEEGRARNRRVNITLLTE